jgi:hypothetical protein
VNPLKSAEQSLQSTADERINTEIS